MIFITFFNLKLARVLALLMKFEFAHKQIDCGSCACSNKDERVGFISVARLFYDGATFLTRLDCETT